MRPERGHSLEMALGIIGSEEAHFIDRQPLDLKRHGFKREMIDFLSDFSGEAPSPPSEAKGICQSMEISGSRSSEIHMQ